MKPSLLKGKAGLPIIRATDRFQEKWAPVFRLKAV